MKIGDHVVCVDDSRPAKPGKRRAPHGYPVKNGVYKILGFDDQGDLILNCKTVVPARRDTQPRIGWKRNRFRLLEPHEVVDSTPKPLVPAIADDLD